MPLVTIVVFVVVVLAYAIYRIARENAVSSSSPSGAASYTAPVTEDGGVPSHDVFHHVLSNEQTAESGGPQTSSAGMIPISTIEERVEQFKASYHGDRREEFVARIDEAMRELKSRYGNEVPFQELIAFMKSFREKVFPRQN